VSIDLQQAQTYSEHRLTASIDLQQAQTYSFLFTSHMVSSSLLHGLLGCATFSFRNGSYCMYCSLRWKKLQDRSNQSVNHLIYIPHNNQIIVLTYNIFPGYIVKLLLSKEWLNLCLMYFNNLFDFIICRNSF